MKRSLSPSDKDELTENVEKEKSSKKKKSGWRIFFIVLAILLLAVLIPALVITVSLFVKYRTTSYEYQKPVVREEEYVMPEYPEVIPIPEGVDPETFVPESAEQYPAEETVPVATEQTESAETPEQTERTEKVEKTREPEKPEQTEQIEQSEQPKQSEPAAETKPEDVQTPAAEQQPAQTGWTGEALPSTVNASAQTPNYDSSASFANSPNAVSVYTGIPIYQVARKNADIQNILVLGTDSRDVTMDRGRSDVMLVVSYNQKTGSVKLTSLLRDSFVPIEGHDWNRLNTAYFYGGVGLAVNTINQIYGLDIQDFVVVDFNGVKDFFTYIGGVDVYLTQAEVDYYGWTGMQEGVNHLNGSQALAHVRNRTLGYDFERTRRQRDVFGATLKAISQKPLTEIYDIVNYSFSLIKTNISALSMASLAASVLSNASNLSVETQNVPYADAFQNAYYGSLGAVLSYDIGAAAGRIHSFIYQ